MIEGCVRLLDLVAILAAGAMVYWLYAAGKVDNTLPYRITVPTRAMSSGVSARSSGVCPTIPALHLRPGNTGGRGAFGHNEAPG